MTDARFPERWLQDRRFLRLTDAAFRLQVTALAWSASNRTDGVLDGDDLMLMPRVDPGSAEELVKAGLWSRDRDRFLIGEYEATQTTAEELARMDDKRRKARDRKRAERARTSQAESLDTSRVTSRSTSHATQQARTGQARTGQERLYEEQPPTEVWPEVAEVPVYCNECDTELTRPKDREIGKCPQCRFAQEVAQP